MSKIVSIILLLFLISCNQSQPINYALISGRISNATSDTASVRDNVNKLIKKISIKKDGSFSDTIFNTKGYYSFSDGNEHTAIYLEDTYALHVEIDTKEFDESIVYTGNGSFENNFLAQKYLMDEKSLGSPKELYTLDENDFLEKVNVFREKLDTDLNKDSIGASFRALEKENLKYEFVLKLRAYEGYHSYLSGNENFKVSDNFPDSMKKVAFNNEDLFKTSKAYQQLAIQALFENARSKEENEAISFQEAAITLVKKEDSELIRNEMLSQLSYDVSIRNENAKELYNDIMALSTDETFKERLTQKFNTFGKLAKGAVSPIFVNYENYNGGSSSLSDFKGKFVYIDVWATWCAPCRAEIPALKDLNKVYKDKDIVFVSISVDKQRAHEAWKQMIKDEDMKGVQLFADKEWKSSFVQNYAISGIPRFILIDKEGKIVSSNAPRPSDPELISLFKEQGI